MRTLTIQFSAAPGATSNAKLPMGADHSAGRSMRGAKVARDAVRFETRSTVLTVAAGDAWMTAVSRAPTLTACAEAVCHPAKERARQVRRRAARVTSGSELKLVLCGEDGIVAGVRKDDGLVRAGGECVEVEALAK